LENGTQRTGVATVRVLEQYVFEVHDVSFIRHLILKIHQPLLWLTPCYMLGLISF